MKKSFSLIFAAALVLTLTACNKSGGSSDDTSSSDVVSSDTSQTVSSADNSVASPESSDAAVSDDPIIVPDDPNNPDDPDPNNGGVDNSGLELPDNRAGRMVKAGLAVSEWGAMMPLDAEAISSIIPGLNADDCEECCGVQAMISAVANEVYCIKPKDGKLDAVRSALNDLVQTKKDDPMQYPAVQEVWEQAVVEEDGGYIYLVVHPDSQTVADTMGATK